MSSRKKDEPENMQLEVYSADDAREQAEFAMQKAVLSSLFSVKKPRDVVAGTTSGLKTVAKGVGLGLASLVAQPIIGARTGGAKGFIKGMGTGTLTCVASAVTGTVLGTGQIVRGVVNTPGAIVQKARGQVWNSEDRKWEVDWYSLPEEEAEVFANGSALASDAPTAGHPSSASTAPPSRTRKNVVDRTLYDLLEVAPESSDAEVRKAFYKKSLALHPDKNPDNPEATQKFQAVSDAYRILGDPERRRAYDEHGQESAAAGLPKIEPAVFFAALFGSHHFEPYIGRLKLAQEIDGNLQSLIQDVVMINEEELPPIDVLKLHQAQQHFKLMERQRQVRCAVLLVKRLEPLVGVEGEAYDEAFKAWEAALNTEISALSQKACGMEMLFLIGWVYSNRARQFFAGGMLRRVLAKVEGEMHLAQSKAKLAGSVGRTAITVNGIVRSVEKKKKKSLAAAAEKKGEAEGGKDPGDGTASTATPGPTAAPAPEQPAAAAPDAEGPSSRGAEAPQTPLLQQQGRTSERRAASPASESGGEEAATGDMAAGSIVMLRGLRSTPELNDEVGMICGFDAESGRYFVQILPDGGLKKLKPENLLLLEMPAGDAAAGGGGDRGESADTPFSPDGNAEPSSSSTAQPTSDGEDDADMKDAFKDCTPLFHDALWGVTALDVEYTLGKVIEKALRDMSVDKKTRRQRADALLKLGQMMQEPMKEWRKTSAAASAAAAQAAAPAFASESASTPLTSSAALGTSSMTSLGSRASKSVLARLKQKAGFRGSSAANSAERQTRKAREADLKQRRMEAAFQMMVAGASTEDVDEMAAACAAMDAESSSSPGAFGQ